MFDDFQIPFFSGNQALGNPTINHPTTFRNQVRDIFTTVDKYFDEAFTSATRSLFQPREMYRDSFGRYQAFHISFRPPNIGVTLNGEPVEGTISQYRPSMYNRHRQFSSTWNRLQPIDSNYQRSLGTHSNSASVRRNSKSDLLKLPTSIYRIQKESPTSADQQQQNTSNTETTPVVVKKKNSIVTFSPGTAYLEPEATRVHSLVEIQPLLNSPSRGHPECEVCLLEYKHGDQLRHLPCGHAFHAKCIDAWFNESTTCPKCRAGVRSVLKRLEKAKLMDRTTCKVPALTKRSSSMAAPVRAISKKEKTPESTSKGGSTLKNPTQGNILNPSTSKEMYPSTSSTSEAERTVPQPPPIPHSQMAGNGSTLKVDSYAKGCARLGGSSENTRGAASLMDKSAFARKMAREMAIRRAEQQKLQQEQQQILENANSLN